MAYPNGTVPTDVPVHPTPVYETLVMGGLAIALWRMRDTFRPGILFAIYAVGAGLERFLIEFIRRNEDVALGLSEAQFFGLLLAAVGVAWLVLAARSGPLRLPPEPAGPQQGRPRPSGDAAGTSRPSGPPDPPGKPGGRRRK